MMTGLSRLFHPRRVFPLPAVLLMAVMMLFPVLYTIYLSAHEWSGSAVKPPVFVGAENYVRLWHSERFWAALGHTLYFTVLCVVIQGILGMALALVFNREFKGRGLIRTLLLLPMMATPIAVALVWRVIFDPTTGVLNQLLQKVGLSNVEWLSSPKWVIPSLVIVDSWQHVPFVMLIILAGLSALPSEPFEAGLIDGASPVQLFRYVTLPLLRPVILVAALFRTIDALKAFDIIYAMTGGGPARASETLNMLAFDTAFLYFRLGDVSALLVVFFLLILGMSVAVAAARRAST